MSNSGMNGAGDKVAKGQGASPFNGRSRKAGPFHKVKAGPDLDAWLRLSGIVAVTRKPMLRCIKALFYLAKAQNYLPDEKTNAVERMQQVRVKSEDTAIFSSEEIAKLLHHAPPCCLIQKNADGTVCPNWDVMDEPLAAGRGDATFHPSIRCGKKRLRLPVIGERSPRAERPRHSSPIIHKPQTKCCCLAENRFACF